MLASQLALLDKHRQAYKRFSRRFTAHICKEVNVGHFYILHFLCALNCVWIHQQQIQKWMFFKLDNAFFCLFSGLTHYKPSQYVQ